MNRIAVIDALRGVAILMVVATHTLNITSDQPSFLWPLRDGGVLGVDLFFFISGFVLYLPLIDKKFSFRKFFTRRFFKIVPSYWLSIAGILAFGMATGFGGWPDLGSKLLFTQVWYPGLRYTISGVYWSLCIEVQFYLMFPFIAWCFKRQAWLTAIVLVLISNCWDRYQMGFGSPFYVEQVFGYLDLFTGGIVTAILYKRLEGNFNQLAGLGIALLGMVYTICTVYSLDLASTSGVSNWAPVWKTEHRTILAISFGVMALGLLLSPGWFQGIVANPVLLFFGAISYNLYLWHQSFERYLAPMFPHWYIVVAGGVVLATVITYCFERPIIKLGHKLE